ncbi:MAG: DinB family protein [Armatimonas sp.]
MAKVKTFLKARFAYARKNLEAVLNRLQDSDLSWTPREDMPTIADLLLEIANKNKETPVWVQTGVWPDDDPDSFDIATATVADIRATLSALQSQTYAYMDSLSEEELERPIANPNHWGEALGLPECPLSEVLRGIAQHEYYHTGQLITYLWLRGDNPNEW